MTRTTRILLAALLAAALAFPSAALAAPPVAPPPVITSISHAYGAPGTEVTVIGTGFGRQKRDSIVWFNGERAHFTSWTDTRITFDVPSGVAAGYVGIQNDAGCSNGFYFIPFDAPVVTSVSHAEREYGATVTITGQRFEATQGDGWVSFAGTPGQVVSWSDTAITVTVPEGAAPGYVGVVQHGISSNGTLFTPYHQPVVAALSTVNALVGEVVTVRGSRFGTTPDKVVFNGAEYEPISWSDTEVSFVAPGGAGSGYAGVKRGARVSNGIWLTVAPKVDGLSAWWAAHGSQVTVRGSGFGAAEGDAFVLLLGGNRIPADAWSDTSVTFTVPAGAGSGYVGFTDAARWATSNGVWLLVLDNAQITSVTPADVEPGGLVTVTGTDFGPAQPSSTLQLGTSVLAVVSWTDTEIVAYVPDTPTYGYLGVWKSGVASNGMLVNVSPQPVQTASLAPSLTQAQMQTAFGPKLRMSKPRTSRVRSALRPERPVRPAKGERYRAPR